ncbi:MAG: restriction endonuclease subunit S [Candidatus Magasanikbacteria bacterium]
MVFSIIQKLQLEGTKRLDAEYYQPEYLRLEKILANFTLVPIKNYADHIFSGPFGSSLKSDMYTDHGVPFIRIGDIVDLFISKKNLVYIPEKEHIRLFSTHLDAGDIILSKIGTVGRLSVITPDLGKINISENNIGIKLDDLPENRKIFLLFFLLSKYGQFQILRKASGNIQLKLNVSDVEDIFVPQIDDKNINFLLKLYKNLTSLFEEYKNYYQQAEDLFLKESILCNFLNDNFLSSVVNLNGIQEARRIDAEYFNSPCNKMLAQIAKSKTAKLGDLADMNKGVEPGADAYQDEGKLFIRVSSISKDGIIDKDQKYLSEDLYNEHKKDYQPQVGDILLTKDASIGVACVVREPVEGIVAGGVLRLKLKEKMNPEYLALVLNSIVGQMQAKRDAGGSIIAHWKPEQIKNLIVPILPAAIQEKIAGLIVKSHEARKKAKELLEEAKLKVEEMMEKGGR